MLIVIDVYVCYVENINKNKRKSIFKQDPGSAFGYSPLGMCFLAKVCIKKSLYCVEAYDCSHGDNAIIDKNLDYYFMRFQSVSSTVHLKWTSGGFFFPFQSRN